MKRTSGMRSRGLWWLAALAAVVVSVPGTAAHGAAADEELMEPNAVWVVDAFVPGTPLDKPEDNRLRGYGFAASIEGVSEALMVERVFGDYKPAPGQKILVFAVKFDRYGPRDHDRPVRGTVLVDGRRTAVEFPFNADGPLIAASVPVDAVDVQFELAAAEVAQTFSLTQRKRVGRQPVALYRDPAAPEVVSDVNADRLVKATDDRVTASVSVTLKRVRLSWFSPPEPVTTPASTDRAYLVAEAEAEPGGSSGDGSFEDFATVPASDVKLRLADGTQVEGKHAGETDELLSGSYYFEVPADLTAAILLVGPTTVPAKRRLDSLIEPTRVRIEQASFEVNLPPGNPPVRSEEAGNTTTPARPDADRRTAPAAADRGGRGATLWPVLLVAAVAAVAFTGWRVRRRTHPASESPVAQGDTAVADEPVSLLGLSEDSRLAVGGPGALDAVRAAVLSAGADSGEDGSVVVIVLARDEVAQLVPSGAALPAWLRVAHDEEALFAAVDVERLRHARLHDEREPDRGLGADPTSAHEALHLVVVLPGPVDAGVASRLLDSSPRSSTTVLAVCDDAPLRVEADGRVDDGGVRVAVLAEDEAAALLGTQTGEQRAAEAPPAVLTPAGDEATAEVVSLRLLGPFGITVAGREVFARLRSKGRELLALLAVNREGITADAAMEALWPGATTDPAYFRTVVANLRTVLRDEAGPDEPTPVVERLGQRYRLNTARVDVDLWLFEDALSAAARGDDEAAEAAADAYRGDLLDGEDWPWADPVRERLRRRVVDNLTALAERRRAAGDLDAALHAAERAVERDPYSEELYQRVMKLHRDLGRPDGARRTYEVLEARLRDLGVTPNPTSRALGNGAGA